MKIKEMLINDAKLLVGNLEESLTHLSKDTRTLEKKDTYIALVGETFDGNDFYEEALKKGASTLILSKEVPENILKEYKDRNIILVSDTVSYLISLAKEKRKKISVPIIAITGSVGKTSTRNIVAKTLETKYKVLKTSENLNTDIGLSMTLLNYQDEEAIVLEMGMNHEGEIRKLTNIAKPDVAIITNIGTAHIGYLGSRENILKAKLEILEGLSGPLIINYDNDLLHDWKDTCTCKNKIITYAIKNSSDYQATNITYDTSGSHFLLNNEEVRNNVIGAHFIYNSLVAFAIANLYQISRENVKQVLKNIPLEKNRMELIHNANYTIINDTYNASYDSIYYALEVLSSFKNRKIAILGDILELGSFAKEIHEQIGDLIIKNKIDILYTVGENAIFINNRAISLGLDKENSKHFLDNHSLINDLKTTLKEGDVLLIKASNAMKFIEIVDSLK